MSFVGSGFRKFNATFFNVKFFKNLSKILNNLKNQNLDFVLEY